MKLITGANGRIGNVLVKELNKTGEKVKVLLREGSDTKSLEGCNCEYVYGDILDIVSLAKAVEGVDTIFHLAAHINISQYDGNLTLDTNVKGTKNIIEICLKNNINLVYTSSIHSLSASEGIEVIDESTPFCVDTEEKRGIYDCSKAYATKLVIDAMEKGLNAIIIYPTGVSGPYDYKPSFFGQSIIQLLNAGLRTTIEGAYDYVDVRDLIVGILKAYEMGKYGERYILSGEKLTMIDLVKYLREFTPEKEPSKISVVKYGTALFLSKISSFFNKKSIMTPYGIMTLHSNANISHKKATNDLRFNPKSKKETVRDQWMWFKANGYI